MRQESQIEKAFIQKLIDLGYAYRPDIRDREALERNFRQKFDALNKVQLSDREFTLLLEDITTPDVFAASKILRNKGTLIRDDNTSLDYQLLNLTDWCKNDYEVISQLRMNTHSSHQRYDVLILIGGLPLVQIELKALPASSFSLSIRSPTRKITTLPICTPLPICNCANARWANSSASIWCWWR